MKYTLKHLFVPFNIAKLLDDKGFDDRTLANYFVFGDGVCRKGKYGQTEPELFIDENLSDREEELGMYAYHVMGVPIYQQVIDWLEENHKILIQYERGVNQGYYSGSVINDYSKHHQGLGNISHFSNRIYVNNDYEGFATKYLFLDKAIEVALNLLPNVE